MHLSPPIYLHFLDRELWEAVDRAPVQKIIDRALKVLLLGTGSRLFAGLSLVWENPVFKERPTSLRRSIVKLIELGAIDTISQYPTAQEFLETRRQLYLHDKERYQIYFHRAKGAPSMGPSATTIKTSSATLDLATRLRSWGQGSAERLEQGQDVLRAARRAVRGALSEREGRAITYALFRAHLGSASTESAQAGFLIRRQISTQYSLHYMDFGVGDAATGINGLSYFDGLGKHFPNHDVDILNCILSGIGFKDLLGDTFEAREQDWIKIVSHRSNDMFARSAVENLRSILGILHVAADRSLKRGGGRESIFTVRDFIRGGLFKVLREVDVDWERGSDPFNHMAIASEIMLKKLTEDIEMREAIGEYERLKANPKTKVLLVTTAKIERDTVIRLACGNFGISAPPQFGPRRSYFHLGDIGGAEVLLVQCEMGSSTPGASFATVRDALDDIGPSVVIAVGIAFGVDEKKQKIGDILVGKQLQNYDLARVGTTDQGNMKITPRGDKVSSSSTVLSRLRAAEVGWAGRSVHFGVVLTGEKLVDNIDFRSQLMEISEEAIGGEMEGAGVYAAASDSNVDWIVVKAICDWADGAKGKNKKRRQAFAAEQSAEFVLRSLRQGGFSRLNWKN